MSVYRTNQIMEKVYSVYWTEKRFSGIEPNIRIQVLCNGSKTNYLNIDIKELMDIIEVVNKKEAVENEN